MRIYKKCPCCGKMIFLLLGSEFGNEVEFGSGFGKEHKGDWECLNNFLACLKGGHGEIFISLREKEKGKIPENYQELIMNWTEGGFKPEKEPKKPTVASSSDNSTKKSAIDLNQWKNVSLLFTEELAQRWIDKEFSFSQVKEWIDVGFKVDEYEFCKWLRDVKKLSAEDVLNYGNDEELRREFEDTHTNFD